ncbi:hypothetical protein EsHS_00003505 [Epichloe bromicola]
MECSSEKWQSLQFCYRRTDYPAKHNGNFKHNGPVALAKAYQKFNKPVPADVANAIHRQQHKRTTGSATTTSKQYDSEYLTPVQVGTPVQTLHLNFDTGSSDLWVFSAETPSNEVNGQMLYNPDKSSSANLLSGQSWSITYGDQSSSSGSVFSDVVTVGGLTVNSQAVEAAEQMASTTLATLILPNTPDQLHIRPSVDSSQGFWTWTSTGYAVGPGSLKRISVTGIADTSTTLLLLPDSIVDAYYAKVPGVSYDSSQGGYTFDCDASLPSFTFVVSSSTITIPGSYINFAPPGSRSLSLHKYLNIFNANIRRGNDSTSM